MTKHADDPIVLSRCTLETTNSYSQSAIIHVYTEIYGYESVDQRAKKEPTNPNLMIRAVLKQKKKILCNHSKEERLNRRAIGTTN